MKNLKIVVPIFLSLFVFVACGASSGDYLKSPSEVSQILAEQSSGDLQVIDVRTLEEFKSGCLLGAKNIDFRDPGFMIEFSELDKDGEYLIYCRSGNRSSDAFKQIKAAGFENVLELEGGVVNWEAAGYKLSDDC